MVIETEEKELKNLYESIFWDEDDPRRELKKLGVPVLYAPKGNNFQSIDMSEDSFIWAFCGARGAGKSLSMTYYAAKAVYLYGTKLVSNFPINFQLIREDGTKTEHHAEPLDMYKLLCFDSDYQNCLILMDEAPDIISHLAAQTWKNRLLNIFVRQLRKNRNSLFLGAQNFMFIDKSMRWQTDIIVDCKDAFRHYGGSDGLVRGACILLDFRDNSGLWTGIPNDSEIVDSFELPGRIVWGAYNTYFQQDVWESLKKVDMSLMTYKVGQNELDNSDYLERTKSVIESIMGSSNSIVEQKSLYKLLNLTSKEKNDIALRFNGAGIERFQESSTGKKFYNFSNFDLGEFLLNRRK